MLPTLLRARVSDKRIVAAGVLAVFLVAFFVVVAIAQGIGDPSVPSDDVAVVEDAPDGHITTEEFQTALAQAAASGGQGKVPPPSSPQYAALRESAMSNLLTGRWVRGEAEERGITLSDSEIDNQVEQLKKQFGGEKGFRQALKQAQLHARAGAGAGRAAAAWERDPGAGPSPGLPAGGLRFRDRGLLRGQQVPVRAARDA